MDNTKNSINDTLARLAIDIKNMNAFLYSLQKMLNSKSDNVTISQTLEDGTTEEINVPSYGYLKGLITNVSSQFETLISANDDVIGVKSANGDVRKFELKKVSKIIQELEEVSTTSLTLPTSFGIKNNWFFESFLNPLLFVSIDISSILTDDIDQFDVKRLIINSIDDDELAYFDDNYDGQNDLNLETVRLDLEDQGIDFFEDDNVVPLATSVNRFRGTFDFFSILEEEVETVVDSTGETVNIVRNRYKLNTLTYTDIIDGVKNSKILSEGDVLITDNDSEYEVTSVNKTNTEVVLKRIFGIDPITIGADILKIKPEPYRDPVLNVNVGFNEREIIFIKPISKKNNLTTDEYSNGFGMLTNNLTIKLEDDSVATLEQYYNNFVSDFGMILLGLAKEKKIPSIFAETPNSPILNVSNFSVENISQHIKEDEDEAEIRNLIAEKEKLKTRITENLKKIDDLKSQLNDSQKTDSEKARINKKIASSIEEKSSLQTQLTSTVKEITNKLSTTPAFVKSPKYRVRGFWPIPDAKTNARGTQEIVQFKVRYRYLSKKGTAPNATQSEVTGTDGTTSRAVFSPWIEVLTKSRVRALDESTGLYYWKSEDLTDADVVNANQIDIPINKGEIVEIQVRSLSEAGWPDNSVESDWSTAIQIPFPDEIESTEEATVISQRIFAEEARLDFEDELTSRGLDLHLQDQFTTGERFFPHKAENIASGFFTSEGNIIDLFEKLKSLTTELESIKQSISLDKGIIKVSIIDADGNTSEVKRGDTMKFFAGYYRDQIKDTSGGSTVYNDGAIITKQYVISIQNTSATALELVSLLKGGVGVAAPSTDIPNPSSDYDVNRRYDKVPLSINEGNESEEKGGVLFKAGTQSSQVQGQFINSRFKNYGLNNDLYKTPNIYNNRLLYSNPSAWIGELIGNQLVPISGGHYLPFQFGWDGNPTVTWTTSTNIWNGVISSGSANGGGYLNEFCIHKNHPDLDGLGPDITYLTPKDIAGLIAPYDESSNVQSYLLFSHAPFFETSKNETTGILGNAYYQQSQNRIPTIESTSTLNVSGANFPIKLGFTPNDEWLVGKYTCGSYLYMFPGSHGEISVTGNNPELSIKEVKVGSENSINIPVLFQYRASDKLGYIGGYRKDSSLKNIAYQKRIGIDIHIKDSDSFSFDIEVSCQYKKETTLDSPIVPSKGTSGINY
jgi:hypothetical protein